MVPIAPDVLQAAKDAGQIAGFRFQDVQAVTGWDWWWKLVLTRKQFAHHVARRLVTKFGEGEHARPLVFKLSCCADETIYEAKTSHSYEDDPPPFVCAVHFVRE